MDQNFFCVGNVQTDSYYIFPSDKSLFSYAHYIILRIFNTNTHVITIHAVEQHHQRNTFCVFPTSSNKERRKVVKETMVWFVCDDCGDSIKKPALKKHFNNCSASRLSCVDCGAEFDRYAVQLHTKCVTEHEKYALGATKPGGKANVVSGASTKAAATREPAVAQAATAAAREEKEKIVGREYLATEAPWMCSCCNVECTGAETLKSHALGKKHKRKAKTLRTQKEEENEANDEGKPKSMSPSAEEEKKKKKKEEKRAKKKLVRLKSKENKKKILEEKLKVAKEKKARKDEKKRKREEEKTDEEKAKDAEKAKEREVKKAKRIELKAVKREKKLARKKAKQEAKKNGRGKTNVAALGTKEKGVKKKKVKAKYSGGKK